MTTTTISFINLVFPNLFTPSPRHNLGVTAAALLEVAA
jgi:hypothetical protein